MGLMAGLRVLAILVASGALILRRCIRQETPAVPALCAPARQWTSTLLPAASSSSTN